MEKYIIMIFEFSTIFCVGSVYFFYCFSSKTNIILCNTHNYYTFFPIYTLLSVICFVSFVLDVFFLRTFQRQTNIRPSIKTQRQNRSKSMYVDYIFLHFLNHVQNYHNFIMIAPDFLSVSNMCLYVCRLPPYMSADKISMSKTQFPIQFSTIFCFQL
jgi:hypothetical protein